MNFTFQQLRSFLAASEELNFSAAADKLRIRQPTLSANIKSLEAAIGGRLFDRDTHIVRLTDLGVQCQRHARVLLADMERAKDDLSRRVAGVTGTVRVAVLPYIFPSLLVQPFARFRQLRPDVVVRFEDVSTSEAIEMLRRDQVDLAIANELVDESDIRYQFLAERRMVAMMRQDRPLGRDDAVAWRELKGQELIIVHSRDLQESRIAETLRNAGLMPSITHRVNQLSTAVGLVEAGYGVAMLAQHTAAHALRPGLAVRRIVEPELVGRLSMLTLAGSQPAPQARMLQDMLLEHFRASR